MMDETSIELPDNLDIRGVESLHEQLELALGAGKNIKLLGRNVVRLDTAAIQVLIAFKKEVEIRHLKLKWIEPSSTVVDVFSFLALDAEIGIGVQEVGATS